MTSTALPVAAARRFIWRATRGFLTLPMCHRNALHGIVLVGRRPHGKPYRPDVHQGTRILGNRAASDSNATV